MSKKYGVFAYHKDEKCGDDQNVMSNIFESFKDAIRNFRESKEFFTDPFYVELWESDESGLWGNSGEPLATTYN